MLACAVAVLAVMPAYALSPPHPPEVRAHLSTRGPGYRPRPSIAHTTPLPGDGEGTTTRSAGPGASVVQARFMLLTAGAVWGTYPVVLRALYAAPGPTLPPIFIVAVRFVLTTLIFMAFEAFTARRKSNVPTLVPSPTGVVRRRMSSASLSAAAAEQVATKSGAKLQRAALELACLGLCGNFLSVWGLSHVAATIAETLLGCVHIFVPLIAVGLGGARAVGMRTWQACLLSFTAVCVATGGGTAGAAVGVGGAASYSLGVAALIVSAGLYSLARVRTAHHIGSDRVDPRALNRRRMGNMGAFATAALLLDAWSHPSGAARTILASVGLISPAQWLLILTSCLASGFIGSSLQFEAQKVLPAASSQPFFALQPLFACGWTWLFLAEPIAPSMLTGGAMMVAGALLASTDSIEGAINQQS